MSLQTIGGYTLASKLGQGGMGAVYRATHPGFPGRAFALKVLTDECADPIAVARFQREMQALAAATKHPGVVGIYGGTVEGQTPFFVMELVEGVALSKLAQEPLEPARAARIALGICDAMEFVHKQGIIHRDLKPANVIVEAGDRPRICDFGLARVTGTERLTRSGIAFGTAAFSAPEQLDGRAKEADARADVYAIGSTLWYSLVGRPPFEADSGAHLVITVLEEPAAPPSRHASGVPPELDAICLKALEKEPPDRYPSAQAMADDLGRFLRGEPVSARPLDRQEQLARLAKKRGFRLSAAASVAILVVLGLAGFAFVKARDHLRATDRTLLDRALAKEKAAEVDDELEVLEKAEKAEWQLVEARAHLLKRIEAEAPRETPAAILALETLAKRRGAPPKLLASLREALLQARLDEAAKALAKGDLLREARRKALAPVVELARELPERVSLAGELEGSPLVLGAALAEAGLLDEAKDLVDRRLKLRAKDPAALLLRAQVALARAQAPIVALGRGRLGVDGVPTDDLCRDLESVREKGGSLGGAAAWLLVDLLVQSGPARDEDARAALDKARPFAHPAAATLERVLGLSLDVATFSSLMDDLAAPAKAPAAALVLSRFFARLGAPEAFEHPELFQDGGPAACEAALDADDQDRWRRQGQLAGAGPAPPLGGADMALVNVRAPGATHDEFPARFAGVRAQAERRIVAAIRADPKNLDAYYWASDTLWGRLSTAVHGLLHARAALSGIGNQVVAFSTPDRNVQGLNPTATALYSPRWEAKDATGRELQGVEACALFDRRLDEDVAEDPFLSAALEGGLPRVHVDDCIAGAKALRRVEELEWGSPPPADRRPLAFEALVGIERLARWTPVGTLAWRIRLRRAAGADVLAALDLRRVVRHLADAELVPVLEACAAGKCGHRYHRFQPEATAEWADICAGAAGGAAPGSPCAGLLHAVFDLATQWTHEASIMQAFAARVPMPDAAERVQLYRAYLNDRRASIGVYRIYRPLLEEARAEVDKRLAPTPDGEARARKSAYVFKQPKPGGR